MKSKVIAWLMLLMTGFSAQAQTISGKLVDEENRPLAYANVVLLSLPDSTFAPMTHTPKGEFAGALSIEEIQTWQEEHPDAKLEGVLAPLKDLDFDANPVVVIVEP